MEKIINLTQHAGSEEQKQAGLIDLPDEAKKELSELLTFSSLPSQEEIINRAIQITELALKEKVFIFGGGENNGENISVMIGGALYLMAPLERKLKEYGFTPIYAFSQRESIEKTLPDGSVQKTAVFKHCGFVEA